MFFDEGLNLIRVTSSSRFLLSSPLRAPDLSGHCRTPTASARCQCGHCRTSMASSRSGPQAPVCSGQGQASTAGPHARMECQIECQKEFQNECQNRCQKEGQNECQIEGQTRMSEQMPERMSEQMPDRIPERMPERMPEKMSEQMPERMPDRIISEYNPDRMPEQNVRIGCQVECQNRMSEYEYIYIIIYTDQMSETMTK